MNTSLDHILLSSFSRYKYKITKRIPDSIAVYELLNGYTLMGCFLYNS